GVELLSADLAVKYIFATFAFNGLRNFDRHEIFLRNQCARALRTFDGSGRSSGIDSRIESDQGIGLFARGFESLRCTLSILLGRFCRISSQLIALQALGGPRPARTSEKDHEQQDKS